MMDSIETSKRPLGLFIQPACLQHRYIRHVNSSHIFERPERLRAVLLGVAAAVARLEEAEENVRLLFKHGLSGSGDDDTSSLRAFKIGDDISNAPSDDISSLLSSLSIHSNKPSTITSTHFNIVPPPIPPSTPGHILLYHPALQLAHTPPIESHSYSSSQVSSSYLKNLFNWANEAVENIKETGNEIPQDLNQSDLYLGPGSILAIEGAVRDAVRKAGDILIQML